MTPREREKLLFTLLDSAESRGFYPKSVRDEEEELSFSQDLLHTRLEAVDHILSVDSAALDVINRRGEEVSFLLVWGNEGIECIGDHTDSPTAEKIISSVEHELYGRN